jgi:hypothetical protein
LTSVLPSSSQKEHLIEGSFTHLQELQDMNRVVQCSTFNSPGWQWQFGSDK